MQWFSGSMARRKYRKQRQEREKRKEADSWKTSPDNRKASEGNRKASEDSQKKPEENRNPGESRRKAGKWFLKGTALALGVLFLAGSIAAGMKYRDYWMAIQAQLDIQPDAHAKKGSLYGEEAQGIAPGSFWVLVNQIPTIEEGDINCNIEYENPESNHYSARISLYLKETGKLLGNTKRVDPGNYVETIRLKQELPAGEYPVRANIELFRNKTPAGNLAMDISLRVLEKGSRAETLESEAAETAALGETASKTEKIKEIGKITKTEETEGTTESEEPAETRKEATGWETAENGPTV